MQSSLKRGADELEELRRTRRDLHRIPELAGQEKKTRLYIEDYILSHTAHIRIEHSSEKGLIASYQGGEGLPVIGFRAELDALPIEDAKDAPYKSVHPGLSHACGHDAHMSILLQLLRWVDQTAPAVNCRFIFQAAEEVMAGARELIPLLRAQKLEYLYSLHVTPDLYAGYFSLRPGLALAGCLNAELELELASGHASDQPDVLQVLSEVQHFQQAYNTASRFCKITHVETNGYYNVIPDRLKLYLTFRSAETAVLRDGYEQLLDAVSASSQVRGLLDSRIISEYPCCVNDTLLTKLTAGLLGKKFGSEHVLEAPFLFSSDDFAFYARDLLNVKTCYYFIGAYLRDNNNVHTGYFDIDEHALLYGLKSFQAIIQMFGQAGQPRIVPDN
ncbi:amidohydrolase [Paenibacillus sp. HN-1]|uniref:M20 metallopeptidase family protein n=1 Tax=Paenibacillus TaxID=44249 RepID=UPI001CA7BA47|nr:MULTISPECIES: M20 family metallopeptidase [Paenibacillus]MBY9077972.1 amidohydrolase [Paenibacillus sp. CGMCC 1.18879]MBY9083924.1 amidohydrolase [Paenibacillus sinensis]